MNGSRNPTASPTRNQPGPARRVTRPPSGAAPASWSQRSAPRHVARIVVGRWDGRDDRVGHRGGALAGEPLPPRPTQDDPDVDPPAGHRGDPDIAAVEHPQARVVRPLRPGIGQVIAEADPLGEPARSGDARRPRDDRMGAVRADHDAAMERAGALGVPGGRGPAARRPGRPPRHATPRRTVAPASAASTSRAGSSDERSKPTAGGPPRLRPVRQADDRSARRLEAHRRDRARHAGDRRARGRRADAAPRP